MGKNKSSKLWAFERNILDEVGDAYKILQPMSDKYFFVPKSMCKYEEFEYEVEVEDSFGKREKTEFDGRLEFSIPNDYEVGIFSQATDEKYATIIGSKFRQWYWEPYVNDKNNQASISKTKISYEDKIAIILLGLVSIFLVWFVFKVLG